MTAVKVVIPPPHNNPLPVQVASPGLLEQYLGLLPPTEREYVGEGASEAVRKERLLARTLVRSVLKR